MYSIREKRVTTNEVIPLRREAVFAGIRSRHRDGNILHGNSVQSRSHLFVEATRILCGMKYDHKSIKTPGKYASSNVNWFQFVHPSPLLRVQSCRDPLTCRETRIFHRFSRSRLRFPLPTSEFRSVTKNRRSTESEKRVGKEL